jgi:uncharacterized membrane protein YGL010W
MAIPMPRSHASALLIVIGWALQIVGHQYFEQRRPALLDNPIHMLISPMYIFAKLFVVLGFRRDLAALLQKSTPRPAIFESEVPTLN